MQKLINVFLVIGIVVAVLFNINKSSPSLGSVPIANEYQATSTKQMAVGFSTIVSNKQGTLGSVVVASTSATLFRVWNATSTTDISSTTVADFKPAVAEGTYTFDNVMNRGIIIETTTGFSGRYTITFHEF